MSRRKLARGLSLVQGGDLGVADKETLGEMNGKITKFGRLKSWRGHRYLAMVVRFYLAFIFITACIHKIQSPESFAVDIATYQLLPLIFINLLAIMLPWIELGAGVMLATGTKSRSAALMVSGMMIMFMIALTFALVHDLNISCGCFASDAAVSDPISFKTLIRDATWLLLSIYVVIFDEQPIGVDSILESRKRRQRKAIC